MPSDAPLTSRLQQASIAPGVGPNPDDVFLRAERVVRQRRIRARMVGVTAAILGVAVPISLLFGPFRSELARRPQPGERRTPSAHSTSTLISDVREGRLVIQVGSGLAAVSTTVRSIALGGDRVVAYAVSPDGTRVLGATYVLEPPQYTREDSLFSVDIADGRRSVLVRAGAREDLGPAEWSPDGSMVAYRLTVLPSHPTDRSLSRTPQMLCVVAVSDRSLRCSSDLGSVDSFAWSPDGTQIVVDGTESGAAPLRLFDVGTGNVSEFVRPDDPALRSRVGPRFAAEFMLTGWSATGRYLSSEIGSLPSEPAIFDREGRLVALGHATREGSDVFTWSPVGDRLAYAVGTPPYAITSLYVLDPETGQDRLLYSTGDSEGAPVIQGAAWSPSGRWIAVLITERTEDLRQHVVIVDTRSGGRVALRIGFGSEASLVGWGPD